MQLKEDIVFDERYLLKKLLGSGGFSEVWLVEDTKVGNKKMALKVYAPGHGLDSDGIQLFSSEFELVFDLNHTNLLRPAYFDVFERSPYLLMPYCEQGSANKLIGQIDEEDAWNILHDVSSGLAFLHAQEPPIVHQDIKPDNILKDQYGHYQITDFGISTKIRSTLRKSMIDSVKEGGTMAYMPPERFGKDNIPIKASDIWATGATVFELLTGDLPFGEHGGAMQKSGAEIPNISGNWSNELREIITRCLQKDPWDRPVAQQIVEWAEKRLKGEILSFETTKQQNALSFPVPDLLTKKIVWGIGGCVLGLLLSFIIAKNFMSGNPDTDRSIARTENRMADVADPEISIADAGESKNSLPLEGLAEREQTANLAQPALTDKNTETQTKTAEAKQPEPAASASETSAPPPPPTWIAEYDRITGVAQAAYNRQRYETAKAEYTKALTLAVQYGDRAKQTAANRQITECNNAIEAEKEAVEKARQDRLALYNFIGRFPLGPACMVVQKKSDKRWGIIDREGNEVEAANYDQVSARLKNGYYALKNDRGWVVFDTSLKKVATGLDKLDEYQ